MDPTYTWPCRLGAYTWQVTICHMHRFSQNSTHLFLALPIGGIYLTGHNHYHQNCVKYNWFGMQPVIYLWMVCSVILLSVKATSPCWSHFFDSPRRENTPLTFLIRGWVRDKSVYWSSKWLSQKTDVRDSRQNIITKQKKEQLHSKSLSPGTRWLSLKTIWLLPDI